MSEPLKLIFAGTPAFAVPALRALIQSPHQVAAVYTQPDRPAGRGRHLQSSPVKNLAERHHIPVYQPLSLRASEVQQELADLNPDVMIVSAYGLILPPEVLAIPKAGCINIHASLLPRWRGAAPIQRAILAGDSETGITLMQMDKGLDTGDILLKKPIVIESTATAAELHDQLAELGGELILTGLKALMQGSLQPVSQNNTDACYAPKLVKEEAWLDWGRSAEQLARQVRALNPWPVAQTGAIRKNKPVVLRVWNAIALPEMVSDVPGTVLRMGKAGVDIATGQGVLRALELQWPGGRPLRAVDFANAGDLVGQCLKKNQ